MRRPIACFALVLTLTGHALADPAPSTQPAHTVEARMKTPATFKAQPTRLLADLPGFAPTSVPDRTAFGGVTRYPKSKATGFFRTEKIDGRWWLIDPQGCRTINTAVVSTNFGQMGADAQQAYDQKFGSPAGWAERTRQFLRDNGFDGTGNWSADAALAAGTDHPLVRTSEASFMGAYAAHRGGTHAEPGHLGYPNKCIFVFDPQFAAFADTVAAQMASSKDDPYLLGWFTDNELPFPLEALDQSLTLPAGDPGRAAADAFVRGTTPNDSNKGVLNRLYEPYVPLLDAMRQINANRYALADYFDRRK